MSRDVSPEIARKFGRRLAHLLPLYGDLQTFHINRSASNRIILKTVYVLFDSEYGLTSVMFFRSDHLEFGFSIAPESVHDLGLTDAPNLGFPTISSSFSIYEYTEASSERLKELFRLADQNLRGNYQ